MANRNGLRVSLVALLLATPLTAQSVRSQIDRSAKFSSYGTYSWTAPAEDTPDGQIVRDAMNRSLAALGWRMVPSGGEVQVTAKVGLQVRVRQDNSGYPRTMGSILPPTMRRFMAIPGL